MIYIQLIYNLSMLIALSVLSGFVGKKEKIGEKQKSVLQGIIFGMVAVVGMLFPVNFAPGLIFDGRSVVISLCALFFGPVSAIISALLPAVLRVFQGGMGTLPGVLVIVESALIGLLFHYFVYKKKNTVPIHILLLMGLLVHITMVLLMLTLPADIAWDVVKSIGLPVISIYPGATILIGKIISDNLEKNRFMASLKESEEKYRMLIENQTDLVVKVDKDGKFLYVSPSYCKTFGKSEKELIGKTFLPLVHEEDIDHTKKEMEKLNLPPYSCYVEQRAMTKDGWRWFGWTDTAELNDKKDVTAIIGVGRDITEKKQAESDVLKSEETFKSAVNQMQLGMAVHEMLYDNYGNPIDYRFIEVNPEFEKMTGLHKKELIGRTCLEVLPNTEKLWIETYAKVTKKGTSLTFENFASTLNKWFRVYAYKTRENEFAVVFDDITERKRYEEDIRLKMKELQDMNSIMIDREIKMTELKEEIDGLLKELGREPKY